VEERIPVPRPAARVLLFDDANRLLLFRIAPEATRARRPIWFPPGGGLNEGETHIEAARREIWEETGLKDVEVGACIWYRSHRFEFQGQYIEQQERYFVARCAPFSVVTDNMEEYEFAFMAEHRWWSADEIVRSDEWFVPRALARHLPNIVAGKLPPEPFDVGV
jgi:8-oxo-dGTP pyrophosphatase MutT (NUDIX family)